MKEWYYKLSFILLKSVSGRWNKVKSHGGTQMVVIFTIKEMSYLAEGLFYNLVRPFLNLYLWY